MIHKHLEALSLQDSAPTIRSILFAFTGLLEIYNLLSFWFYFLRGRKEKTDFERERNIFIHPVPRMAKTGLGPEPGARNVGGRHAITSTTITTSQSLHGQ